jgi:hypothetical protein
VKLSRTHLLEVEFSVLDNYLRRHVLGRSSPAVVKDAERGAPPIRLFRIKMLLKDLDRLGDEPLESCCARFVDGWLAGAPAEVA